MPTRNVWINASHMWHHSSCEWILTWIHGKAIFRIISCRFSAEANISILLITLKFGCGNIILAIWLMQIPAVYWWYKTASHAAELTAGFYNPTNQDGYFPLFDMLKKHSAAMKFVCYGPQHSAQESDEALSDLEGLSWQVATIFCSFLLDLCSHFIISGCHESFSAMNQQ